MSDPLTTSLLSGAHQFLISAAWVLAFAALGFLMLRSLMISSHGRSQYHPLVWLVLALSIWSVMLLLWCLYQPDLVWGLVGLGIPVFGVVWPMYRPRVRRFRSRY